jgi:esterase/lipase superfamily enzyme
VKETATWYSERLGQEVRFARWGEVGQPVLIFPTAGGDAEEIERFLVIDCLAELLRDQRIKVYSCDSVAGRVMLSGDGPGAPDPGTLQDRFQEYVFHEVVPAIRNDCRSEDIGIYTAGASIGAFNALAAVCRYPTAFTRALCMSGTFDLVRFLDGRRPSRDFYRSSPVHYLPHASAAHLEQLRKCFVLLASGEGRAEDIQESWRVAHLLGQSGVPNRVDSWGEEWHHDWPTWRAMLPKYLGEWTSATADRR